MISHIAILRNERKDGFTLIELLVVIAIIAILAAILFPVFTKVKEAAKKSTCQSNLAQLNRASQLYIQDNDETLIMVWLDNLGYWPEFLMKYIKNKDVFCCPTMGKNHTKTVGSSTINPWESKVYWSSYGVTYGFNADLNGYKLASIKSPTRTVNLADCKLVNSSNGQWCGNFMVGRTNNIIANYYMAKNYGVDLRHDNCANILFFDGHTRCMAWADIKVNTKVSSKSSAYSIWDDK